MQNRGYRFFTYGLKQVKVRQKNKRGRIIKFRFQRINLLILRYSNKEAKMVKGGYKHEVIISWSINGLF